MPLSLILFQEGILLNLKICNFIRKYLDILDKVHVLVHTTPTDTTEFNGSSTKK